MNVFRDLIESLSSGLSSRFDGLIVAKDRRVGAAETELLAEDVEEIHFKRIAEMEFDHDLENENALFCLNHRIT